MNDTKYKRQPSQVEAQKQIKALPHVVQDVSKQLFDDSNLSIDTLSDLIEAKRLFHAGMSTVCEQLGFTSASNIYLIVEYFAINEEFRAAKQVADEQSALMATKRNGGSDADKKKLKKHQTTCRELRQEQDSPRYDSIRTVFILKPQIRSDVASVLRIGISLARFKRASSLTSGITWPYFLDAIEAVTLQRRLYR